MPKPSDGGSAPKPAAHKGKLGNNRANRYELIHGHPPTSDAEINEAWKLPDKPLSAADMNRLNGRDEHAATNAVKSRSGGGGVVAQVVQFFRDKGLPDYQIAGILGNMRVESGFNTGATNAGEGAVGLVQWEGGRDDALRAFCAANGMDPGSVDGQLNYLWHELNTSESGALSALRQTTNAGDAAAVWDSQFERSSGDARGQRVASAQAFMSSGLKSDGGAAGAVGTVSAGSGGGTANAMASGKPTEGEYMGIDSLGQLLKKVPQLNHILQQAEAGGWTIDRFTNAIEDSAWFKNHSQSVRSALAEQANDPATWHQDLQNTQNTLTSLAKTLGFTVDQATLQTIATNAILTGNQSNQDWLRGALGHHQDFSGVTTGQGLQGQMSTNFQQLQSMSKAYGISVSGATLAQYAEQVALGNSNLDHYQEQFKSLAAGMYPGLVSQLQAGQTVQQIADPYVQQYAQLLELNPTAVDWTKTPIIQQALQGVPTGQGSTKATMSLNDFEKQVRTDPRWQYTQNAKDTFSTALVQVGRDFGFGGF